ncbi:hypothetical protein HK100_011334 [Physocladia obscura]|uniref:PH domain-containing protein n=1 Tax=Physocladia obscura TaxID=109957 RepID=A0AAD5T9F6_9FUNG|nr:hypothetical protein HK100_011334 [Physocladia obscura]
MSSHSYPLQPPMVVRSRSAAPLSRHSPASQPQSRAGSQQSAHNKAAANRLEDLLHSMGDFGLDEYGNNSNISSSSVNYSANKIANSYSNYSNYNPTNRSDTSANTYVHRDSPDLPSPYSRPASGHSTAVSNPNRLSRGSDLTSTTAPIMLRQSSDALTLESLQLSSTVVLSTILEKLNASSGSDVREYKQRLFILTSDSNLFLFKATASQSDAPITFLPLLGCDGFFDSQDSAWILKIHGKGLANDSTTIVKRTWTLRFSDEATMILWVRSINRTIQNNSVAPPTILINDQNSYQLQQQQQYPTGLTRVRSRSSGRNEYSSRRSTSIPASPFLRHPGTRSGSISSSVSGQSGFIHPNAFAHRSNGSYSSDQQQWVNGNNSGQEYIPQIQQMPPMIQTIQDDYFIRQRAASENFRREQIYAMRKEEDDRMRAEMDRQIMQQRTRQVEIAVIDKQAWNKQDKAAIQKHEDAKLKAEKLKASLML